MIKNANNKFDKLIERAGITRPDEQLELFDGDPNKEASELSVFYPYSKIATISLYLYSMEFGSPPLYSVLNRACRDGDDSYLETLGPYAKVLSHITSESEMNRDSKDKIKTGVLYFLEGTGVHRNTAGIFLLWRGANMLNYQINAYKDHVMKEYICLPGNASCSQDVKTALGFALDYPKTDHVSVLFVISCRNYEGPRGIRLNNEAYSAFPGEREILLTEGACM